jgi:alkaline phosphatase
MSKSLDSLNRRQFVKGVGLASTALALGSQSLAGDTIPRALPKGKKAKNLIFLVVDGMGKGTLSLGHHWSLHCLGKPLNWTSLCCQPGISQALQDTASASSPVTDSAAAASAWGCGQRVMNRSINVDANGVSLNPLYSYAKAAGKATGLVTTCRVTHATPAGFVANVADRDSEDEIARQYLKREVDVLLGGGRQHFQRPDGLDTPGSISVDLIPEFKARGYACVRNKTELNQKASVPRLLGLFSESHIPHVIDRKHNPDFLEVPDLPMLFKTALESLSVSERGFVLQVEAGRVDHAGHVNDPAAILHELLEFDRCIPIALEYLKKDPDTLLIITTDHGTGGCQLNGLGDDNIDSGPALRRINEATASFEALEAEFIASGWFDRKRFVEATGISPTKDQADALQAILEGGKFEYFSSEMTQIVSEAMMQTTAVGWTSNYHTAELVDLFAMGPGSEQVTSFIKNNELFDIMKQALGV